MKVLLLIVGLALGARVAQAQRIRVGDEEFMDTTSSHVAACAKAPVVRYYQVAGKYPRSPATLLHEAQAFLRERGGVYSGSGYVTFRFIIDCQGHREPRTQVLETDRHYQRTTFAPELVAGLYAFLQTLTAWQVGKAPVPVRYITYLNFKVQDGKVVAVTP